MRLLYTLRYGSDSGNCGGDLRLFITTQNSADWQPSPPAPAPGMWLLPINKGETLMLPSGDSINYSLYPVNNGLPGMLYLFGAISVTTAMNQNLGNSPLGQSTVLIQPNQPAVTIWQGRNRNSANGISWDIGFDLAVPWDGTSADCTGQWWAIWHT